MNQPHLNRALLESFGTPKAVAKAMQSRAEKLRVAGSPLIYSLNHLALSTGVEYGYLRGVVRRDFNPYTAIRIPKSTGGYRALLSPTDKLKQVQRWILHEILGGLPNHPSSYAYYSGARTVDCARRHVGAQWIVKADFHNFFPSIDEGMVYKLFRRLGYSALLAFELSRLCTWPSATATKRRRTRSDHAESGSLPYEYQGVGSLPQGAPTSGALANAFAWQIDEKLSVLARANDMIYTRYSDDIALSSGPDFSRDKAAAVVRQIRKIVTASGLSLHEKKTQVITPGARKIILGIMVTDSGLAILPEHRRMVQVHIYATRKYGLVDYSKRRGFDSPISFINHVEGWLAYLVSLDKEWVRSVSFEWNRVLSAQFIFSDSI